MNNPRILTKIKINGKELSFVGNKSRYFEIESEISDDKINASIIPLLPFELVDFGIIFDCTFNDSDVFFANGYQSWTTSREYMKTEVQPGIIPLAKGKKLSHIAGISADTEIVEYSGLPGSFHSFTYAYRSVGNYYELIGSLSERSGYTIIRADMVMNTVSIQKDVQGLFLRDGRYELLDAVIFRGGYDEVFDNYFAAMKLPEPRIKHMAGYTSWYNYFQKINEKIILRDLDGLDRVKDKVSIFQIDDGYETFVGDWLDPCDKFPNGMKYIADKIHDKGYMAGIWIAPFNVQIKSRTYKEHPDWVVRDESGKPVLGCVGWGGAYTLDIYNKEARAYIKHFFDVILNEWGYDMVKLDFLYSQCHVQRRNKTRGTIMCEAMEFLRECCGDKLILGCGAPLGPAFGYVDACRVTCDVDLSFAPRFYNRLHVNNEIISAQNSMNNTIFRRHLNGRAFCNDPDVFFLRDINLKYTDNQKLLLARINNMFGDVLFVSDNVGDFDEEKLEILGDMFSPRDVRVYRASYVAPDVIKILYDENGLRKCLMFNKMTGVVLDDGVSEIL